MPSNSTKEIQTEKFSPSTSQATVQTSSIAKVDKDIQTDASECDSNASIVETLADVTLRVIKILKNSHLEIPEGSTIFETLAKQYVEANWKKEMLERKLTEITRELNLTAEMRDSLQIECDDSQSTIETLMLQIDHLKSSLPSIPENSEERVAMLETETESMNEKIQHLKTEREALRVKHFELITAMSSLEGSLRNQENLEAEVRNTKDQLAIAKQQLDGASKNVENNENTMEDLRRRLHASLEENNQLRKKIDELEVAERRVVEQLRKSEKELEDLRKNFEKLQEDYRLAIDSRNKFEQDISIINEEKQHLETELSKLRKSEDLREQLDKANRDKDDLEYDILNMRKELDSTLAQLSTMETQVARLTNENSELLEQLSGNHDDATERIELLQTEMSILNQEHTSLKHETTLKLETSELERRKLSEELTETMSTLDALKNRCQELEALVADSESKRSLAEVSNFELTESREKLEIALENAQENASMAKQTIENLSQLIREKDSEIESLKSLATLSAEREELVRLVQEKHNTSLQYYAEIQRLAQLVTDQAASLQQAIAERDEKAMKYEEKEAEILWAQNELQVVRQRLKSLEESHNNVETCGIVEHSVKIAEATMLNEKCNALEAALIQEQSNNRIIQNQLTESQSREVNAARELERLRTHLVEMQASYTEDALVAEESRRQLEAKLAQAEEKAQNSSTVYTSASIRANQQVETLQQQMSLIVQQRDEIQSKLSAAEDKVLSHTASLTNLQIVLEQFQRGTSVFF